MKLGDIARESRETYKGNKTDIPIVGLEHLISGELRFNDYEVNTDNTFTKVFHKGQILFGRRRAYLKKAAVAEFDGICSGDITVIEAIPGKVDARLLPFIIQNDRLFAFAVSRSAGGLSPRVKWEHLADYEFELPSIEEQRVLADKLWAAYELKEAYKKMIAATDEMVKSQFIEMFGDVTKNSNDWREYGPIGNYADIVLGSTPDSKNPKYWDGDICWVTPAELNDDVVVINDTVRHITNDGVSAANLTKLPKGSVLFSTRAPIGKVAITGVEMYCNQGFKNFICGNKLNNLYLYYTLKLNRDYLCTLGTGTTFKELSKKVVESISIAIPPIEMQNKFEDVFKQADKSKFELRQAIDKIDKVMKSLLQ